MLLSKLKPYKGNPRQNDEAVAAVVKSIEQFGKIAPIICNGKQSKITIPALEGIPA